MIRETSERLLTWYENRARPFIQAHAKADLPMIDRDRDRVTAAVKTVDEDVAVCFVGTSGVGKSTLLNALLSDRQTILPNDQVGPQTARPTTVRYSPSPYFKASYVGTDEINELRFLLEVSHRLKSRSAGADAVALEAAGDAVDETTVLEMQEVMAGAGDPNVQGSRNKLDRAEKRARLLIQGSQDGTIDLEYLVDATRSLLGTKPKFGREVTPEDDERVLAARACVELGRARKSRKVAAGAEISKFLELLARHAAGSLAPLILELEVGWASDVLSNGLVLVDLPGLGVEGDEYKSSAESWISQRARSVLLVTDSRGLMSASVEPLRKARFFNKLLHADAEDGQEPVSLGMVMVKVDDLANALSDKEYEAKGDDARAWGEFFASTRDDGVRLMRAHLERELKRIVDDGIDATREDRRQVTEALLSSLRLHAVSAPEYRRFLRKRPGDPAKVTAVEESGIPALQQSLKELAAAHRSRRVDRIALAAADLEQHARATINVIRAMWDQEVRAEREAKALSDELDLFIGPLRKELEARRHRFGAFLGEAVPAKIGAAVSQAALDADPALRRYLRQFQNLTYPTLAAIVRKGGRHEMGSGKLINMPKELALRFEEPIAVAWAKGLLVDVRKRTAEHGKDYTAITKDLIVWAKERGAKVRPKVLEALHDRLDTQSASLAKVGKEAVDEIRQEVSDSLAVELEKHINKKFMRFVELDLHRKEGAKKRIVDDLLGDLAQVALAAAQPTSKNVLVKAFEQASAEIRERLAELPDPLDTARASLVQSHEDSVRRSDARKREGILAEIDAVLAAVPPAVTAGGQAS